MTTPTTTPPTFRSSLPAFALAHHVEARRRLTSDGHRNELGGINASVSAYQHAGEPHPAFVSLVLNTYGGVYVNFDTMPDTARALAAALVEAADICDAFEAHQTLQEEHETARLNAGPWPTATDIVRIDLPGGVIAFEDAGEVGA